MNWKDCIKQGTAKNVKQDTNLIRALQQSAEKKFTTQKSIVLTDETVTSRISLAYDALRELLEALAITNNYKIYNHECYIAFLKELLNEKALGEYYNTYRKIRNDINYYGKDITTEEATAILEGITTLIKKVKEKL
ncbi:MAG TPA: hypothetical protein VJB87_02640 [Candidatus Nanoarchaeia archaeon]|nr:hypothetical protein [Candidatus Nanoarchaeia archaeon]